MTTRAIVPPLALPTEVAGAFPSLSFQDLGDRLQLTATKKLTDLATGRFDQPRLFVDLPIERLPQPIRFVGFSFAQFAMPVRGADDRPFDWRPAANIDPPAAVIPLLMQTDDGRVCLMAPLDRWHAQSIAVVQDESGITGLRWGWHGDIEQLAAGERITLAVYEGQSPSHLLDRWGADIGADQAQRQADPVTSHLSYWTDNGAAYWYRTEPGRTMVESLTDKMAELRRLRVPVRSVELDSWFYRHEISRPVSEVGYLEEVPSSGMLEWQPRPDVLPDGIEPLADALGRPPLVLHSRHISVRSPYLEQGHWWSDVSAHPRDPDFFDRWMADAASWGATCVEQDWMVMHWFGVRQLRAEPGRAMDWQRGLDAAAAQHDLSLIWCMATGADLAATVELQRIAAVRTCDDYRYADDPARLWVWYLTVNRLARALLLPVSKDCFFTGSDPGPSGLDGDHHVEVEALLSAMSAGVAGIGDRLGHTDVSIIERLCRPDGLLVAPDRPLALADVSFFGPGNDAGLATGERPELTWAETATGPWRYLVALHAAPEPGPIDDRFELDGEYLIYDWRAETATVAASVELELRHRDWALFICCPITDDQADPADPAGRSTPERGERPAADDAIRRAVVGDVSKYATMGRTRITVDHPTDDAATIEHLRVAVAPGEDGVMVRHWTNVDGLVDRWVPADAGGGQDH